VPLPPARGAAATRVHNAIYQDFRRLMP